MSAKPLFGAAVADELVEFGVTLLLAPAMNIHRNPLCGRGFEIAVKESKPLALMTSYNQLNGAYTGCRRDLVTDILRCEWGYKGLVMTDWGTKYDPAAALHA